MKNLILPMIGIVLIAACSKSNEEKESSTDKVVDDITLSTYNFTKGYDTTGNFIVEYGFKLNYETQAWYVATSNTSEQHYEIRYVGGVPLLSPDNLKYNTGEAMMFPINSVLKGKPIFEVYNLSTSKLVKRIVASADSCNIFASYSVFANNAITPTQIRNAFHYYLTTKQTAAIKYYNTKD